MEKLNSEKMRFLSAGYSSCDATVDALGAIGSGLIVLGASPVSAPLLAIGIPMYGLSLLFLGTDACHN